MKPLVTLHSVDHSFGWESSSAVERSAEKIGRLIGADTDEIVFTSGATEANNLALLGIARHQGTKNIRKRVILSAIEHKSILTVGRVLEEDFGFQVDILPVDQNGHVCLSELERIIDDDVLLVSIMAVNNEIGTLQDIEGISAIARRYGAVFHCDAAQAPFAMNMGMGEAAMLFTDKDIFQKRKTLRTRRVPIYQQIAGSTV